MALDRTFAASTRNMPGIATKTATASCATRSWWLVAFGNVSPSLATGASQTTRGVDSRVAREDAPIRIRGLPAGRFSVPSSTSPVHWSPTTTRSTSRVPPARHSLPLTGAIAGGLLLHLEGRLHSVVLSSEQSENAALLELRTREGPAREAFRTGDAVRVDRVAAAADHWPEFVRAAAPYGSTSAFAVPLRLRDYLAGSLVAYGSNDTQQHPSDADAKLLRGLADVATIAVLQRHRHRFPQ